jgi:hypothetical protein
VTTSTINGLWRVASSTDSTFARGMTVTFSVQPDGLAIESLEGTGSVTPWRMIRHTVAPDGQSIIDTAGGTLRVDPTGDARTSDIAIAIASRRERGQEPRVSPHPSFPAGDGQVLVLYGSGDTGDELDPAALLGAVAADAAMRAETGWRMVSMVALPLRHGGEPFGLAGSGFTTKAALGALYALPAAEVDWLGEPASAGTPGEPR